MTRFLFILSVSSLLALAFSLQAQDVTLTAAKDNTLYEDVNGETSNGSGSHFFIGVNNTGDKRRAVIYFDIASAAIPEDSQIDSVKLYLNMSKSRAGSKPVHFHKLENSWGEGTSDAGGNEGSGTVAATDDATWLHNFYDQSLWLSAGGDFATSPSATGSIGDIGTYGWASDGLNADVQDWLDNPGHNHGWLIMGDESTSQTTKRFDSRENETAANRPMLQIWYSPATSLGEPPAQLATSIELGENYPNPFNPSTSIPLRLHKAQQNIHIRIFNSAGELVNTLYDGNMAAGEHTLEWDGSNNARVQVASGVYYLRVTAKGFSEMRKMVLIR